MIRRTTAALLGVVATFCMVGSAAAEPMIPASPPVPPTLHCHTPWQFPRFVHGQWECLGGPGPVVPGAIYH